MPPQEFAKELVRIAESDPIYQTSNAVDEVIYLLAWYIWDMVDDEMPDWTEALGHSLDRLRPGITSQGSHERFAAYSEAKADHSGGGPMWHLARVFQAYSLGTIPANVGQTTDVALRISVLAQRAADSLLNES